MYKKLLFFGIPLFFVFAMQAQDSPNKNLTSPPLWGPAGYSDVRYYYLPDVESYYDIYASQFVCNIDGEWLHRKRLLSPNKNYDLYLFDILLHYFYHKFYFITKDFHFLLKQNVAFKMCCSLRYITCNTISSLYNRENFLEAKHNIR